MEARTITALAAMTDEGLFERLATAVLRLVPDYEGIAHTGITASGKTRKSPVDGLRISGERNDRIIIAHHTTTEAAKLNRKWLLDPAGVKPRRKGAPIPPAGDVVKSFEIIRTERAADPNMPATLVLGTNQEPDEALLREVAQLGRTERVEIDIWTRSRIAARLDTDPRGQVIRRKLLGFDEELLSRDLLLELSTKSVGNFKAGDDPAVRVSRALDLDLDRQRGPVTLVVASSGTGKTVAAHKALERHLAAGRPALIIPHDAIEQSHSLDQAVMLALRRLKPSLAPGQSALGHVSEANPLLLLIEDISRAADPPRLVETIVGWRPDGGKLTDTGWHLLCPVWPHFLAGVRSQLRDTIEGITYRPERMTAEEAAEAVRAAATAADTTLEDHRSKEVAELLGHDPLLIGLNRDWSRPNPNRVIENFADQAIARVALHNRGIESEFHDALATLGRAMLRARQLSATWADLRVWGLSRETLDSLKAIAIAGEVLRTETVGHDSNIRFRHDRVRDWLLIRSVLSLEGKGALTDGILSDPALAEIMGAALGSNGAPPTFLARVSEAAPLALFHALRTLPAGDPIAIRVAAVAEDWLKEDQHRGSAFKTLRWQAAGALERVEGAFMRSLVRSFPETSPMGMIALLRNGDIAGGFSLARYDLHTLMAWTHEAVQAARGPRLESMTSDLAAMLASDDGTDETRTSELVRCAGLLGEASLGLGLLALWTRDLGRETRLKSYLWAMARCATPATAAQLLDPICAAWGRLPQTRDNGMPSPRDDLASDTIRFAFSQEAPVGALDYFIERAKMKDLAWQIEYMLQGVDHPAAVLFEMERSAERLARDANGYTFNNHAREHWRRASEGRGGSTMSAATRASMLGVWNDPQNTADRRKAAFDLWAATRDAGDLAILRNKRLDPILADRILRQRLERSDAEAIPELVAKIDADAERTLSWWFYSRYVWSPLLHAALDRALARAAAQIEESSDEGYTIGSTLTGAIMRLPSADAEELLLRYWDQLGRTMHFVQAALFVGTPKLARLAGETIRSSSKPADLFTHMLMHFGHRMAEEPGITREAQIRDIMTYAHHLSARDIEYVADECNLNGWFSLRREVVDPMRDPAKLETASRLRLTLDDNLKRGRGSFIDYDVDRLLNAGVPWIEIAAVIEQWLANQTSPIALGLAADAIAHAGSIEDAQRLAAWAGTNGELLQESLEDLAFALRRAGGTRRRKRSDD